MEKTEFPHPTDPTQNPKIMGILARHGAAGYGVYWRIIEMLQIEEDGRLQLKKYLYEGIASQMKIFPEMVEVMISDFINEFELFATDGDYFWEETISKVTQTKKKVSRVSTYKVDKDLLKKWQNLEAALPLNKADRWLLTKKFIDENNPEFVEPYATLWNLFADKYKLSQIEALPDARKKKFSSRIIEPTFRFFDILDGIKNSNFYRGLQQGSDWKVSWDYIFENETNYLKILEKKK